MSDHPVCLGGENSTPFITNTFYYSFDGNSWNTLEPDLLSIPMLSAHVVTGTIEETAAAPMAVRRSAAPGGFTKVSATVRALTAPATVRAMANASSRNRAAAQSLNSGNDGTKMMYSTIPGGEHETTSLPAWLKAERLAMSVEPHAPIVHAAELSHGRGGRTLDDIVRYIICRDNQNSLYDSTVSSAVTAYDDNGIPENQSHNYWVKARYDDNGLSPVSNMVTAACNMAPAAPGNVALTAIGQSQMRITWNDPTTNADGTPCVDLDSIRVYRNSTYLGRVLHGVHQYTDTPPDPRQVYNWSVTAIDEVPNVSAGAGASGYIVSPWDTVAYDWVDISSIGTNTNLTGDDATGGPFNLGFNFPYFGQTYSSIYACTNGWASFTDGSDAYYFNTDLPSTDPFWQNPPCALFPHWDDLIVSSGASVKYYADAANQRFILAWLNVPPLGGGGGLTFEIILDANGGITYQYQTIGTDNASTVGVVSCDNATGVQLCYDGAGDWCAMNNSAVQFWGGPRQAILGTVRHRGGSDPVLSGVWVSTGTDSVQTDANGFYQMPLDSGTYTLSFRHPTHCDSVVSNVVLHGGVNDTINVALRAPAIVRDLSSLTFEVHRFLTENQILTLSDTGACPLHFQMVDSVTWLTCTPQTSDIAPGDSLPITVSVAPGVGQLPGDYSTNIWIVCNAIGSPVVVHVDMSVLSVTEVGGELPTTFALHANYPNPFNPTTILPFDVPQQAHVDIIVYNVMGQEVARPVSGIYAAGRYRATFVGDNLPSGLYIVKMTAGGFTSMGKMMLLK
jgi:hypothetical protein